MIKTHSPSPAAAPFRSNARSIPTRCRTLLGGLVLMLGMLCHSAWAGVFGNLTYDVTGSSIKITGYVSPPAGALVIPDLIEGKPVTVIGVNAFAICSDMTSVTIPDSVTSIETSAFLYCSGLTGLALPSSLTTIGNQVFSGCSGITSLTLPAGVTVIPITTFSGCSGLQSLTFLGNVTSIGDFAFSGCTSLSAMTLPSSVTHLGQRAFQNCVALTSVSIPSGVTILNDYVFSSCSNLQSVTLPSGLTTIGKQVFVNCPKLTTVTIPAGVTSMGEQAFFNCVMLAEARFLGNAPVVGTSPFGQAASGFTVYHSSGATGYDVPPWTDYAQGISVSDPVADWLVLNGLPADSNLKSDDNHDGVSLLMAYALNLNPNQNLSRSLPQPVFSPTQMSLTFLEASDVVTYKVETSTNLLNWTSEGVTLSEPDANNFRTATVPMTGGTRYMRLAVSY